MSDIKALNNPTYNKYVGIEQHDWITPGDFRSYHVFKRRETGSFVEDYFTIDTFELRIQRSFRKDKQGKAFNIITTYFWPNFGYTPKNFTDADFAYYKECPTMKFL
jgi:hypothetical protein